jgi:hypothetical protein
VDNGPVLSLSGSGSVNFSGDVGTGAGASGSIFSIDSLNAKRNEGGLHSLTQGNSFTITNNDTVNSHILHISISAVGFVSPNSPPPLQVLDSVSGTLDSGHVKGNVQGFTDATNAQFGTGFSASSLTLPFEVSGLSQSYAKNGSAPGFSPNGAAYSMSIFEDITFDPGTSYTATGGNVQTLATPAPAGIALVLAGLPCVGLTVLRRRRS